VRQVGNVWKILFPESSAAFLSEPITVQLFNSTFSQPEFILYNCAMHHPFQVVAAVSSDPSYLIAASGSSLLSVNLKDGTIAAQWQPETVTQHDGPLPNVRKLWS